MYKIKVLIFGKRLDNNKKLESILLQATVNKKNIYYSSSLLNALNQIKNYTFDIIIFDLRIDLYASLNILNKLNQINTTPPIVVLSDSEKPKMDDLIIQRGAYASISTKSATPENITRVIKHTIAIRKKEKYICLKANIDELSSLLNLRAFKENLKKSKEEADMLKIKLSIIYIDLDNFKSINDTFGHTTGDHIIKIFSERLKNCIRKTDICARIGGDEFACIIKNIQTKKNLKKMIIRTLNIFKQPIDYEGRRHIITGSIGNSIYPDETTNIKHLIELADKDMYKMKYKNTKINNFFKQKTNNSIKAA